MMSASSHLPSVWLKRLCTTLHKTSTDGSLLHTFSCQRRKFDKQTAHNYQSLACQGRDEAFLARVRGLAEEVLTWPLLEEQQTLGQEDLRTGNVLWDALLGFRGCRGGLCIKPSIFKQTSFETPQGNWFGLRRSSWVLCRFRTTAIASFIRLDRCSNRRVSVGVYN